MSRRLEGMRANPQSDWRIEDGSSHYKISHPRMREILTIPSKRPIKAVYIRKLVKFIDEVRAV